MTTKEKAAYYRDKHVLERIKPVVNKATAVGALGVSPENYDLITERPPSLEDDWAKLTIQMMKYYNILRMQDLLDQLIVLRSEEDYKRNEIFEVSQTYPSQMGERRKQINQKLPITTAITKYGLKTRGNKLKCPFHKNGEERTPSCVIYPETNSFFCFGCRTGGDVVRFIELMEAKK